MKAIILVWLIQDEQHAKAILTLNEQHAQVFLCCCCCCCVRVTEKGNYTEMDAAHIIRQILQGVQYLHSHGEGVYA
jgi:serine/threonine protein kinase